MPVVSIPLQDIQQSVSRPIILSIVDHVKHVTRIHHDHTILFAGELGKSKQPDSDIDRNNQRSPRLPHLNAVYIDANEQFQRESLGTHAIHQFEHEPIFKDPSLRVSLTPVYATTELKLDFNIKTTSRAAAERWQSEFWMRVSQLRDLQLHAFEYHYAIPDVYYRLLSVVHQHREAVRGYEDLFEEYLLRHGCGRLTLVGDSGGQSAVLSVFEKQTRIVGLFDFEAIPEKMERDAESAAWTHSFSYRLTYQKPIGCVARYPISVHNQLLPKKYVVFNQSAPDQANIPKRWSHSLKHLSYFETPGQLVDQYFREKMIRLPIYDEYLLHQVAPGTMSVFLALCFLEDEQDKRLLDLTDLQEIVIDPEILRFILESEWSYMTRHYRSILQIYYYRNEYLKGERSIRVHPDGSVEAVEALELREEHRVRLAVVTDLSLLDEDALRRLFRYPEALKRLWQFINWTRRDLDEYLRHLTRKSHLTSLEIRRAVRLLTERNPQRRNRDTGRRRGSYTVTGGRDRTSTRRHPLAPLPGLDERTIDKMREDDVQRNTVMIGTIIALRTDGAIGLPNVS